MIADFVTPAIAMPAQCRAWLPYNYSLGCAKRCNKITDNENITCNNHKDYYTNWWSRHIPIHDTGITYFDLMRHYKESILFQLQNKYVTVNDDELYDIINKTPNVDIGYILFLCKYAGLKLWPQCLYNIMHQHFQHGCVHLWQYNKVFGYLYSYVDRMLVFDAYIQNGLTVVSREICEPLLQLNKYLRADIEYQTIVGRCEIIASYFKVLRNDRQYTICLERFWAWVSELKDRARSAYAPLKEELMAAAWEPRRMPFWCLDIEEVSEEFPDGLPCKSDHISLCTKLNTMKFD